MKILLTGGNGYVGSHLSELLSKAGHDVEIFDVSLFRVSANNKRDITDSVLVTEAVKDKDAIIHLAAIVGDPACNRDPDGTVAVNNVATAALVEAAKFYGVKKFILASTCSVYGFSESVVDEHSKLNPISLYGKTKIACEDVVKTFPNHCILRLSTLFGLSKRPRFDLVLNTLCAHAVSKKAITIFGGRQYRPFLHVRDAARAFVMALEKDWEGVYNVGGYNHNLREIGTMVAQKTKCKKYMEEKNEDARSYNVSFAKIKKAGFKMEKTINDGITEMTEFVNENGWHNPNWVN